MALRADPMGPVGAAPEVRIDRLVAGGAGIGRLADGRIVFVPGVVAGEVVRVRLVEQRRDYARAEVMQVVSAAADRAAPPCPELAHGCGGCDWQHLATTAQLPAKVEVVRDALRRTARIDDPPVLAGASVPAWGYRTSLRLAAGPDGRLGLRRNRSHAVVALGSCSVAHPALEAVLLASRAIGAEEVALRVSVATGECTALLTWPDRRSARRTTSFPDGVAVGVEASLREVVAGCELRVSAPSFFQSGPAAAGLLVTAVRNAGGIELSTATSVVDAYGGVGLFAATVAPMTARVVLVESSPSACNDARHNLQATGGQVVESAVERWAPVDADVVIADPARAGLGADAAAVLAATGARVVVLVSCDPVAAARDVRLLDGHGYRLESCTVLDLFPQTHHVETVARMVKV